MADVPQTSVEDAARFLEWKYGAGPYPIMWPTADWDNGCPLTWLSDIDAAKQFIAERSGKFGLFYPVADPVSDVDHQPLKTQLLESSILHADIDPPKGMAPADFDAWALDKLAEVREQTHTPKPSYIGYSGNGIHLGFKLNSAIYFNGALAAIEPFEEYNNGIALNFGVDADGSTWNANRALRLYGSINLPNTTKRANGRVPRATSMIELHEDRVYDLGDFRAVPLKSRSSASGAGKRDIARKEPVRLDDPQRLVDEYNVADWVPGTILHGVHPTEPERWGGDRSRIVDAITHALERSKVPPEMSVGILLDANYRISDHVRAQKGSLAYAWRQVERAIADVAAEAEELQTDKDGKPYANQHNTRVAIRKLGVRLRYDKFADRPVIEGLEGFGPYLDEAGVARLWLTIETEFHFRLGKDYFWTIVEDAARRDTFHPVVEYLDGLQWDGVERLDRWMENYLRAVDSEYVRNVGAILMVAAVKRAREPGCKYDEMVVLESDQGKAKSTALSLLAMREDWFSDDLPLGVDTKIVIERTQGRWIIEAAELVGKGKSQDDKIKAFLSRRRDSSRMAWGRLGHDAPRHFVVVGTTNSNQYLRDSTGNRRFWPVRVGDIDLEALARDRDQLWAEAAAREASGASIRLDPALWQAAALEQEDRRTVDPFVVVLGDVFANLQGKVMSRDVWDVIGTPIAQRTPDLEARVGEAMRELGFERKQRRFGGPPEWAYVRGTEIERRTRILLSGTKDSFGKTVGPWSAYFASESSADEEPY